MLRAPSTHTMDYFTNNASQVHGVTPIKCYSAEGNQETDFISKATLNSAVGQVWSCLPSQGKKIKTQVSDTSKSCHKKSSSASATSAVPSPWSFWDLMSTETHRASCSAPDRDVSAFKGMSELSHACLCSLPFLNKAALDHIGCSPVGAPPLASVGSDPALGLTLFMFWWAAASKGHSFVAQPIFYKSHTSEWLLSHLSSWTVLVWPYLKEVSLYFSVSGVKCPVSLWPSQTTPVTKRDPVMQMKDVLVWPSQISHSLALIRSLEPPLSSEILLV